MTTLMNATLPLDAPTLVHAPTDVAASLPPGLPDADAARIAAARTESTRIDYAQAWGQWKRWCAARGISALPGDPLALCAYLTERAEAGKATGTRDMSGTAIRHVHRMCDAEDPVASEAVRQVRRGLMRTYGAAPRRLARPLTIDEIRQIIGCIDRSTPIGIRDAAMILLGCASIMRRAEVVAPHPGRHSAQARRPPAHHPQVQDGSGRPRAGRRRRPQTTRSHRPRRRAGCLARRTRRNIRPPFTRIWANTVSLEPLSGHVVARMLRARAVAAGLDDRRITAHSRRAGHATAAAVAGVPLDRIAAQTRRKDLTSLVNRYIRPLEALATTSSKDLGL